MSYYILRLKCTKFDLQRSPRPLAGKGEGGEGEGREGRGRGRWEGISPPPFSKILNTPLYGCAGFGLRQIQNPAIF